MNHQAAQILGFSPEDALGRPIEKLLPETRMLEVLKTGKGEYDQEMLIEEGGGRGKPSPNFGTRPCDRSCFQFSQSSGNRSPRSELTSIREYSEALRAQTHEYSNKLHTLAGLIQIGATQESLDLIGRRVLEFITRFCVRFRTKSMTHFYLRSLLASIIGLWN